jgi:hypothetical protein
VFYQCISLSAITVDALNLYYSSVDGVLFSKSHTRLIQYPAGKVGSYYMIPYSVTSIERGSFIDCTNLTNITVPTSVTSIGSEAFYDCTGLISVTIPGSITSIEYAVFRGCSSLTSVTIANGLTNIGDAAFAFCTSLTNIMIPASVTSISSGAFAACTSLAGVYFQGNAPSIGSGVFDYNDNATVHYLPGTTGWGPTFGGRPTAPWVLPNPLILSFSPSFGVRTNRFGFIVSWATNISVVVEAGTNLANPTWSPLQTNTLTDGWFYFSDLQWTNYPGRLLRVRTR